MEKDLRLGHRYYIDLGAVLSGFGIVLNILVTQEMANVNDIGHMQGCVVWDIMHTFHERYISLTSTVNIPTLLYRQ